MQQRKVKDIMIPVEKYASMHKNASMLDMISVLENSNKDVPEGHYKLRSVLVTDDEGNIIGKVGHLAFLKALEPKYEKIVDFTKLSRAGLSSDFLNSMMDNLSLWNEMFFDIAQRAKSTTVGEIMHPISKSIDESTTINEAVHKIIMWHALSIPVLRGKKVVGLIRQADLYREITAYIKEACKA